MGKRILAGVAGLLVLLGGGLRVLANSAEHAAPYGDEIGRGIEHRPPHIPQLPPLKPGLVEARNVVQRWTGHLSAEDAKQVTNVACKVAEALSEAQVEQEIDTYRYWYGEDWLTALQGLVKDMRQNPGVKVVCSVAG